MGFDNQERLNLNSKVLAAGVKDANSVGQWYESRFPGAFITDAEMVWTAMDTIRANPAGNLATAQANAAGPLNGILSDLSDPGDAVRMTEVPGTNGSTYVAYSVFGDYTSPIIRNWMQPQLSPQASGAASIGYAVRFFDGDPAGGGVEIFTTDGTTGTGKNKTVGWIFDYGNGMLILSDDFKGSISDPYIMGFQYIGGVATGGGVDNLDGGRSNEVYGGVGMSPLDGGDSTSF